MPEWATELWQDRDQSQSDCGGFVMNFKVSSLKLRAVSGFLARR
jgi:hypothetical protein